jgi:SAM-dependent methyltransferase
MATDVREIVTRLSAFYDFKDKSVVEVGAGGGQLVEFARPARRVFAVDKDAAALARLAERLHECGMAEKFSLLCGDWLETAPRGDVVLFEFCLHQMADPERALAHARGLAPDVLILDHAPGSQWEWLAAEDAKVEGAWEAAERRSTRRQQSVMAWQVFPDYPALAARLASQGQVSVERIARFRGARGISIPMPYRLALL